jgi:hypothetical protein
MAEVELPKSEEKEKVIRLREVTDDILLTLNF